MGPKFVIAVPHGGRPVPVDWYLSMRGLQMPTNSSTLEIFRKGMPLELAQTDMVEQALSVDADYILFIEDDTQPPPSAILDLARVLDTSDDSVMACGGIYTTRSSPPEPICYMEFGKGSHWNWRMGDVFPCWALGMGCTMIRMKIFKMMERPWFRHLQTMDEIREYPELFTQIIARNPKNVGITTDIFFFTKLAKMGFKVMAHGGVLPVHHDISTGQSFWLPKDTPPTQGVTFDGKPFGWVDNRMEVACQSQ